MIYPAIWGIWYGRFVQKWGMGPKCCREIMVPHHDNPFWIVGYPVLIWIVGYPVWIQTHMGWMEFFVGQIFHPSGMIHGVCSKSSFGILWLPRSLQKRQGIISTLIVKLSWDVVVWWTNPWFLLSRCPGGPITEWSVGQSDSACQRIRTLGGPGVCGGFTPNNNHLGISW